MSKSKNINKQAIELLRMSEAHITEILKVAGTGYHPKGFKARQIKSLAIIKYLLTLCEEAEK